MRISDWSSDVCSSDLPDKHPGLGEEERQYILTGRTEAGQGDDRRVPLGELLRYRQSWGVILSRFFLDPVWWLFVSWLPIYLAETFGFDVKQIGLFAWVPFVGAMPEIGKASCRERVCPYV